MSLSLLTNKIYQWKIKIGLSSVRTAELGFWKEIMFVWKNMVKQVKTKVTYCKSEYILSKFILSAENLNIYFSEIK